MGIEDELRDFVRREARAVFEEMLVGHRSFGDLPRARFLTVKEAAQLSSFKEDIIRKWLAKGILKNYGRYGAPRVKLDEILNFDAD